MKPTRQSPPSERLQKLLAAAGLGSRREIEGWIAAGRLTIHGRVARLGDKASRGDPIALDGKRVSLGEAKGPSRILLYHKPVGELVTRNDPEGRPTVFTRLPQGRWVAVGRLDFNTSGLLLFTDDGELANRLMHPRYEVEREYAVRVLGPMDEGKKRLLLEGVPLDGEPARFEEVAEQGKPEGANRWYRVLLKEGRKREVRRLFEAVGLRVSRLIRTRYGPVRLPRSLPAGRWVELAEAEAKSLGAIVREPKSG